MGEAIRLPCTAPGIAGHHALLSFSVGPCARPARESAAREVSASLDRAGEARAKATSDPAESEQRGESWTAQQVCVRRGPA